MDTIPHDPAWQKWIEGKIKRDKWNRRRALIKKYRVLIASSAVSFVGVTALFFWKIYPLIQEHL
ncbi:hypothetical protein DW133_03430 [Sutterella sp. AM11-39]|uniref:hypothetical protein n=1 Tax=Sutterella sp. AM11-39 TaxID=2292075 RepID=UPI000E4A3ADC|nr:hypothetical protein [Sutterella sp. AM11-39]RHJ34535.1 hypothetical protein DW133_03430 [Sutterella sp. AM11-39]